jgi:SAM-dependent methyltransferase
MESGAAAVVPAPGYTYYPDAIYWNGFPEVVQHLNRLITCYPARGFIDHLLENHRPVESALFLNCGNGWVERAMFQRGAVRAAIGIDIGADMLGTAEDEAEKIGMPAHYVMADANTANLSDFSFQWAVNYAALHHVAWIDRVVRQVWLNLPADGLFINYDYIGPHRNQYGPEAWSMMERMRAALPEAMRAPLPYPHMRTMLHLDPTEAVHSELIVETLKRYFEVIYSTPLGGALAYHLLMNNTGLFAAKETAQGAALVASIIHQDVRFTNMQLSRSLFGFIVCRPKPRQAIAAQLLEQWTREETEREAAAQRSGGRYYPKTELEASLYGHE